MEETKMYRKDYWPVGHYADHIDKYECLECGNEFIVGRKMLEMSGRKKPICSYCGCDLTDDQAGTDDERLEEFADELGCLGLYFDNEEEQRDWTEKEYESGLNLSYNVYNKNMKRNIIFLQNGYINYQEIEQYFKKVAKKFTQIQIDEKKLGGMPVIKNTRIPVSLIIACLKDEMTFQEICEEYKLTKEDIEKAMEYVIEILDVPYQEGLE